MLFRSIVAAAVTREANDKKHLLPMLQQVEQNPGGKPKRTTADSGYFSEAALSDPRGRGTELLVPPDRQKHGAECEASAEIVGEGPPVAEGSRNQTAEENADPAPVMKIGEAMREKLRTEAGKAIYKMRKAVVEPVFGQIKERRRLRGFLMRGREKVAAEWRIIRLTHNLLKLFRAGLRPRTA